MSCELRPKIVIVSDDGDFLALAAEVLRDAGYDVTTCDRARECYRVIRDVRPDIAIVDAKMRDVDDWHVLTLLLLDRELRSIPVLVSSQLGADAELLERRLRELRCRLITKPFTAEELLETVRAMVESRGAA
ncbi:MAG: response regulator [Chloroflexota bacterium]|nr:response regulator [Chloroflexota bacterium]